MKPKQLEINLQYSLGRDWTIELVQSYINIFCHILSKSDLSHR